MLHRVFGRAGSGKTEYLITCLKERQSAGADCLFIVPEQQSVDTELKLEASGAAALGTEVLNFERLPNHIFRQIGGLNTTAVDGVGKTVLIRRGIMELKERLKLYADPTGEELAEIRDSVSALKRLGVTPHALAATEKEIEGGSDSVLKTKLSELTLIYQRYEELLGKEREDDSDGLIRLAAALKECDFFRGKCVFIDGIYTFTPTQYDIISVMAESADHLYISFLADNDGIDIFNDTMSCARKIKAACHTFCDDVFLRENYRTADPALRYAEANLWQKSAPYGKAAESISLARCRDRYDESLRAAAEIFALRAKGYRYDSIAIACRHPENYAGVLDTVLEKYGIPFYFATKDSVATKPLAAFIMGLLDMAAEKMPLWAIKKYLKSSFSVLSEKAVDELLHYGESWRINGKAWLNGKDWLMNPAGYKEEISEGEERLLRRINFAKEELTLSLAATVEGLCSKELTVGKGVRLIYDHLKTCGVAKKLAAAAEKLAAMGDPDGGAKTAALWGVAVDVMEKLYILAGDMPVTAAELSILVGAMLQSSSVGAIPSYADGVSVGDARLMRSNSVRAMLVLGVNDGEFPSLPKKSGVFNSRESEVLDRQGIELLPSTDKAIDQERFFFYVLASAPSEYLSVSYTEGEGGRASPAFNALAALFPHNGVYPFGEDERDYLFCTKAAEDALPYIKNPRLKESLKALGIENRAADAPPLQDGEAYIRERGIQRINLSYSRIDCYNDCGFKHLLRYELKLRDDRSIKFSAVDTGKYMHLVAEEYMKKRVESGTFVPADKAETAAEIEAITKYYIEKYIPAKPSKRLLMHIGRLQNVAEYVCESLCDEFCHSRFTPTGFEVEIGNGGIAPAVLLSPKGRRVITRGFIDRVDSAEIDGKKYVRVVDYKSSKKVVDPAKIQQGEGIQMLSYLFTYCHADAEGALPAGVLYREFALPKDGKSPKQEGLVAADPAVLEAMDDRAKKVSVGAATATEEQLDLYRKQTFDHITETADKILDGDMGVRPFKREERNCAFCPYGEVCRQEKNDQRFS